MDLNQATERTLEQQATKILASDAVSASRKFYFINEVVEWDLTRYIWTGCTDVGLRDKIMANSVELIRQVIRKQRLNIIYPGQEESAFGDLLQTAWVQIEKTLYKYRSKPYCRLCYNPDRPSDSLLYDPDVFEYGIKTFEEVIEMHNGVCPKCGRSLHCDAMIEPEQGRFGGSETILYRGISKVFNMWSQVARTVILAYIKKEGRDNRNSSTYKTHLDTKQRPMGDMITRFLDEARAMCQYNDEYLMLVDAIHDLMVSDERPHDGIIGKLVTNTGLSRTVVVSFMRHIKLRSFEFTDSPLSRGSESMDQNRPDKRRREQDDE